MDECKPLLGGLGGGGSLGGGFSGKPAMRLGSLGSLTPLGSGGGSGEQSPSGSSLGALKTVPGRVMQVETRVESAWFQLLKLQYLKLLLRFAFNFNMRPYTLRRASNRPLWAAWAV